MQKPIQDSQDSAVQRQAYIAPEVTKLGSYIELTRTDQTAPTVDGGPPYCAGSVMS